MKRMHRAAAVTAIAAATAAAAAAFAAPASAAVQGAYEAEYNGACGSGYSVLYGYDIGELGTVYLTWNERTGENCAVTVRARKGAPVYMQAKVFQTDHTLVSASDSGAYTTYAGPVYIPARGECVTVRGQIADEYVSYSGFCG
jgi:hypothetical protein